jgi:hemolysin III
MENQVKQHVKLYTLGEEIANSVTHGVGTLLAIAACVILIVTAAFTGSAIKVVSVSIFGASLILMFIMSTLYHALTNEKAKRVFKIRIASKIQTLNG